MCLEIGEIRPVVFLNLQAGSQFAKHAVQNVVLQNQELFWQSDLLQPFQKEFISLQFQPILIQNFSILWQSIP
jgi:hypothetical protein